MRGIIRTGRQGVRALKSLSTRCVAQPPFAAFSSTTPLKTFSNVDATSQSVFSWTQGFKRYKCRSFRTFSSGGSGGGGGLSSGGGGGDGGGGGGLWAAYLALLHRKPVATKAVTAAILNGLGDVIAQFFFNEKGTFDFKRLGIFSLLGLVLIGPALHVWYGTLAGLVGVQGTLGALGRMCLDQLVFAPVFIGSIVSAIMLLEGHGADVPSKLRTDLFMILRSNWALWVPFQFLNFRFVPVHLQVLASNIVALAWNTYMSWASHNTTA